MSKIKKLSNVDPDHTGKFSSKEDCEKQTAELLKQMYDRLYLMFAHDRYSLLIILQGIDASGKDGTVRNIFQGANPQGIRAYSFKSPSREELRHDFLWRCHKQIPECGLAAVFNRSYYEEVTTVKVHPEMLKAQNIPDELLKRKDFFERRYHRINEFEKMLTQRGTVVLKFFLHISKDEQRERLQERLEDRSKNWKFSPDDIKERKHWNQYRIAFDQMIQATHTKHAPWHIIPANKKWYRDYLTARLIVEALEDLDMTFPEAPNPKLEIT